MRKLATILRSPMRTLGGFCRDSRGIAAVEFALLLPLMVALYVGGVEVTDGLGAQRKVTLTAGTLANLTASCNDSCVNNNIDISQMANILNAAKAVMYPYSTSDVTAVVSCLTIDSDQNVKVAWSESFPAPGSGRIRGSAVTIDSLDLVKANSQLLLGEVAYNYKPVIGYVITGTLKLSDRMYMSPRTGIAPSYNSVACSLP